MNMIMGYPRSGNHWLRYCMANAIKIPMNYCHGNTKQIWESYSKQKSILILIVRNYKESIVRHGCHDFNTIKRQLLGISPIERGCNGTDYMAILKMYDEYDDNKKHLVYFEDLILDVEKELYRLAEFFKNDNHNIKEFMENIKKHVATSLEICKTESQRGITLGDKNKLIYHSNTLSKKLKLDLDSYLEQNHKHLFDKYLTRYKEK